VNLLHYKECNLPVCFTLLSKGLHFRDEPLKKLPLLLFLLPVMARIEDLPDELLAVIFRLAFYGDSLHEGSFLENRVEDWPLLNKRLSPIALAALLHSSVSLHLIASRQLASWLFRNRKGGGRYIDLVKLIRLNCTWNDSEVLQTTFLPTTQEWAFPASTVVHLTLYLASDFSPSNTGIFVANVEKWNVTRLIVLGLLGEFDEELVCKVYIPPLARLQDLTLLQVSATDIS
jgi:hypothetical protein